MPEQLDHVAGSHLRDVETASTMMRRYYRAVRETMRAMAGYLPTMSWWPAKKMLARHIWFDAMHADMLRSRTLDLRYPRVDADEHVDTHLISVLEKVPASPTDAHFLAAVYGVVKPAILQSLKAYLDSADPLDDSPSFAYLDRIIAELGKELREFEGILEQPDFLDRPELVEWRNTINDVLAACGGIDGPDREVGARFKAFLQTAPYEIPMEGGREPSWEKAVMQVSPRPARNFVEEQIRVAIDHANEVWAAETPAALIWEYKHLPWKLHYDAARWCYDEMRHSTMGMERLAALGLEAGIDYPMVPDHWRAFRERGVRHLLLLLHRLEQGGPMNKSKLKERFMEQRDFAAAQDCDYDWADESGHIAYGLAWLKAVFPEWSKQQLIDEGNRIAQEWGEWIRSHHANGTHGYEVFLERMDRKIEALGS